MESISQLPEIRGAQQDQQFSDLLEEMRMLTVDPPKGETVIGAFNAGGLEALHSLKAYRDLVQEYVANEPIENVSYRANKLFKCHQTLFVPDQVRRALDYPRSFTNPQVCFDYLKEHFSDPCSPEFERVRQLLKEPLRTNRYERAKAVAYFALVQTTRNPFDEPAVVHEYGSSGGLVGKALAFHDIDHATVVNSNNEELKDASLYFNLLTHSAGISEWIGIEASPPTTQEQLDHLKGCTFDPSALDLDSPANEKEDKFDIFTNADQSDFPFTTIEGDFYKLKPSQKVLLERKPADIAYFGHVLAQNPRRLKNLIKSVLPRMKPRSLIVVNEYAEPNPLKPQELYFHDHWYEEPWLCHTLVLDVRYPEQGFKPVFVWETAECKKVRIIEGGISHLVPHL